ncbi:peptidase family C50 [Ancylostoma duodenale]|uniref:separase n=1 Tax=Ancylostoma duodenale TaxID=51022 RepID=A0A0C2GVP0_9BILA|nr:peptidase family C50 [Ancylostoma duodenale]
MSKKAPSISKRDVYRNCLEYVRRYLVDLASVQEEVFANLKEEFKPEHVCEPTASPKYLTAITKFTSVHNKTKIYSSIKKCYHIWKDKLQPVIGDGGMKNSYAELPLRLAACFFLNGDYYKALLCLRHSIHLEPKSLYPRILALRWSVYLGEWEMAEMALAFEKAKPPQKNGVDDHLVEQLVFMTEMVRAYVDFNRDQRSRAVSAKTILTMTEKTNAEERPTFPIFETQAFANWVAAHLPKVAGFRVENLELFDTFNCLHRAVLKAESVMKNRMQGIQKEDVPLDLKKMASDPLDFLKACASFAESCEVRRDYAIELLSVGMIRDAAAVSQLGLWCAVKAGVLFRLIKQLAVDASHPTSTILQFVNINTLIRACVVQQEFKKDLRTCMDIMHTIYSSDTLLSKTSLGCTKKKPPEMLEFVDNIDLPIPCTSTPIRSKSPGRVSHKSVALSLAESFEELRLESAKTPPRCKSPGRITSKFIDSFHELTLSETICSLHEISEECECNTCELCSSNYNAAFEYWMSSFLYESMSNESIQCLEKQFQILRARVAVEQRAVLGKKVKPRPPSIMCETFAMCALRWLRSLEDSEWDHDNSSLKALREQIIASTLKEEQKKIEEAAIAEANAEYASYSNLLCRSMGSSNDVVRVNIIDNASAFSFVVGKNEWIYVFALQLVQENDFTIVQLAMSHDGSLHLIKMHKDREPIIMPLAPKAKVESVKSMMDKIIEDNTRTSSLGKVTKDAKAFWAARRSVDGDLKNLIPRVQDILLGAAAPLVLPSLCLNRKGLMMAKCLVSASQSSDGSTLSLSYAKELVSLATKLERAEWSRVVERICDFVGLSSRKEAVQELYSKIRVAVASGGVTTDSGPCYTFMIICPDLTTFPWEVIPVFRNSPYVARIPAVHTLFQTLRMRKKVPVAVNASNAFYILDPDNNLGDTQRRITDYVSKFGWNGVVGKIPDPDVVKEALRARDVFFYMGHGSGSRYFSRRVISENVINAVSVLMGCGSVKLTPYGWGMDGKSAVYDYTVAQCPSVVGCLWTVTDGEIDRYFMALVDLCFSSDGNRTLTGTDGGDSRLRVLVEAMHRARARCKLPYLTGASVVSYGIPVIARE